MARTIPTYDFETADRDTLALLDRLEPLCPCAGEIIATGEPEDDDGCVWTITLEHADRVTTTRLATGSSLDSALERAIAGLS